jgi:hypothetical protein
LPVVWYGFETWYVILIEKHRLKVFNNRVLREMTGTEREEVTEYWGGGGRGGKGDCILRRLMICTPKESY